MPIYIRPRKPNYGPPCPPGMHRGICVDVEDLGEIMHPKYKKSYQYIRFVFAVEPKRPDGKHYLVRAKMSLTTGEKSRLPVFLGAWRGRGFTKDELKNFDIESRVGVGAVVQVVHSPLDNGDFYASINTVAPLPGEPPVEFAGSYVRQKDRDAVTRGSDGDGEEVPF